MGSVIKQCLKLKLNHHFQVRKFSTALPKLRDKGTCLIRCRHSKLDHYTSMHYDNLDEIPLASKGWHHRKSNGDFFIINPIQNDYKEEFIDPIDCGVIPELIKALQMQGIEKLTDFQESCFQTITSKDNALLAAETGCGKTIAYLLPIIQALKGRKTDKLNSPKAVIIVPNRELAYQVGEVAESLGETVDVKVKILIGGRTKKIMMNPTFEAVDVLIATPGALGKLSTVGIYKLDEVEYTVLDEADTLLDDSFLERMESLIKRVFNSQFLLVSATVPRKLPDILSGFENSLKHIISPKIHRPLLNITQKFLRLSKSVKPSSLLQIAKSNKNPLLIFTNKNETCNWLAQFLRENGISCSNINGDMNYAIRIAQWNDFIKGRNKILAATDVGSRGLNTIQVQHVLNYDFPIYAADYIHRIGRVGRFGSVQHCKATNFVSGSQEIKLVQKVELAIRKNQPLSNVDGNITNIVQNKIERQMRNIENV